MHANQQTSDQLTAELKELRQRVAELEHVEARYQESLEGLQKTEDMYQDLYDNAPDMYVSVEPEKGTIIRCNQTLATALGYPKSQIVGRPILELYDPDCLENAKKAFHSFAGTGEVRDAELQLKRKDGSRIDVSLNVSAVRDERGRILYSRSVWRDITGMKRAEDALRESEQRYRAIYNHTPVMMHSVDRDGRLISVNDYWLRVLGYARDEVIGRQSVEFLTEASRRHAVEVAIPQAIETGLARDVEYQMVKKNGEVIDVLLSATIERDEVGEMLAGRAFIVDITERKQAEETLRASEERHRFLYDKTPVMMHSIDGDGRLVSVNSHWLETLGYERDEVIGKRVFDFYTESSARHAREDLFQRFLRSGSLKDEEIQVVKKNGEVIDALLSAHGKWNERGQLANTLAILVDITERKQVAEALQQARDELELRVEERTAELSTTNVRLQEQITERKRAEEALQRNAKRLETLQEIDRAILAARSPEAIAQAAMRHIRQLVPCLRASVATFDLEADEAVVLAIHSEGKTKLSVGARVPLEAFGSIGKLLEGKVRLVGDARKLTQTAFVKAFRAEGLHSWINVPLITQGEVLGTLNLGSERSDAFSQEDVDIAREVANSLAVAIEQARLHEHARQQADELERRVAARTADLESFSYSVSHDLRTPLRAIEGFSRILSEDYADKLDAEANRLLNIICSNTQTMGQLIDDLLAFSRLGRQDMHFAEIDMNGLAQSVFDELQTANPARRLRLELHALPPARGDGAMLRQVFVNLLSNAIKFTRHRETAVIEIGVEQEEDDKVYYIRDNGVGFDMQYAHKLFGVFQRLHGADEFEGTGVGLAIVQRILQRHSGRIWAEGKVDEGATVHFTLPRGASQTW